MKNSCRAGKEIQIIFCSIRSSAGSEELRAGVTERIENADTDDDAHEDHEQLVHGAVVHLLVELAPDDAAADTADDHEDQGAPLERRNCLGDQRCDQVGDLAEQDDVQAVLCCSLCVHTEEVEQNDEVDRAAADAEEAGHDAQRKTDHEAN